MRRVWKNKATVIWSWLTKKRHIYKPYLDFYLSFGFMRFQTQLMHHAIDRYEYTYINLRWEIFKWSGNIRLYKPGREL